MRLGCTSLTLTLEILQGLGELKGFPSVPGVASPVGTSLRYKKMELGRHPLAFHAVLNGQIKDTAGNFDHFGYGHPAGRRPSPGGQMGRSRC